MALAKAEREEAQRLLEEVRHERELIMAESRKIEEANAIIEERHEELLAAEEAFELKKLGPIRVEMATQTDEGGVNAGVQTDADLIEPLVAQRALAHAAEKAEAVDASFQLSLIHI